MCAQMPFLFGPYLSRGVWKRADEMFMKTLGIIPACESSRFSLEAAAMTLEIDRQLGTYVGKDTSHAYVSFEQMRGSTVSLLELSFSLETWTVSSVNGRD